MGVLPYSAVHRDLEREWTDELTRRVGRPVRVRFGRARRQVLVARPDPPDGPWRGPLLVRMNEQFAAAPPEVRELVSVRKDTISHAYELMRVTDDRLRRRLAKRVAAGDLTLAKLRAITGGETPEGELVAPTRRRARTTAGAVAVARQTDNALLDTKGKLASAVDELVELLRHPDIIEQIPDGNRANLAKYLTITRLKLENAIAILRSGIED